MNRLNRKEAIKFKRRKQFQLPHILLAVVVLLILIFGIFSLFNRGASNYEKMISSENITRVNIVSDKGNVSVSMYEGDEIRAYLIGENGERLSKGYKLKMKDKGNQLTLKAKKTSKLTQNFIVSVELPNKLYEQIQVHVDVGNIDIVGTYAASYALKTTVGNVNVDVPQGIINAQSQVGNMGIQLVEISSDITAKTEVGNILVETKEAPEALQTACKTNIGTTTINLPNTQNGDIGTGGPIVKLQTDVGDVSLQLGSE